MVLQNKFSLKGVLAGYGKMVRHGLRYNWTLGLISFIALFLTLPLPLILYENEDISRKLYFIEDMLWPNRTAVFVVVCILALVFSIVMFKYLHSKKSINFYHSLPVKRASHFLAALTVSTIYFIASFLLCVVLSVLIYPDLMNSYLYGLAVRMFFLNTAYFILFSAVFSLCAVLTGTLWSHAIVSALLLVIVPWVYYLTLFFVLSGQHSLYWEDMFFTKYIVGPQSPIFLNVTYAEDAAYMSVGKFAAVISAILAAALAIIIAAILVYRKVRSENAGKTILFETFSVVYKYILTYVIMLSAGYLIDSLFSENFLSVLIFSVAVGFLTFGLINMIFHQNRKKFFVGMKRSWIMLAVFAVIYPLCYFDVAGLDPKFPDSDKIVQIDIYNNGDKIIVNERESIDKVMSNMSVYGAHTGAFYVGAPGTTVSTDDIVEKGSNNILTRVNIKLKNGFTVLKAVYIAYETEPSPDSIPAILSGKNVLENKIDFLQDKDFKKIHLVISPVYRGGEIDSFTHNPNYELESNDKIDFDKLFDCIRKDMELIEDDFYTQPIIAFLDFCTYEDHERCKIYVTENMENTLNYIETLIPGMKKSLKEISEELEYILIKKKDTENQTEKQLYVYDDSQIEELLKHFVYSYESLYKKVYCNRDYIFIDEANLNEANLNEANLKSVSGYLGDIPESIKEELEKQPAIKN